MRRRTSAVLAGTATALLCTLPTAALAATVPYVPGTSQLPPVAPDGPSPDFSAECGADGLRCVVWVEEQLAGWESFFGCDHRAVFPTVYRMLTHQIRVTLEADPSVFDDPAGLGMESVYFYELYLEMISSHLEGGTVPPAWQRTLDVATTGDWTVGHDMLLAINAHVQRDMPFAVARLGLTLPDGSSRKADHDLFNEVLSDAYPVIVAEMAARYDPLMGDVDGGGGPADDAGAMQMVAGWREGVWRHAEQLTSTHETPLYDGTVQQIESNADSWAASIANGEVPGRRALRDAHCAAYLAEQGADPAGSGTRPDAPADPAPDAGSGSDGAPLAEGTLAATGGGAGLLGLALLTAAVGAGRRERSGRHG